MRNLNSNKIELLECQLNIHSEQLHGICEDIISINYY
jgi:hypothetical protein